MDSVGCELYGGGPYAQADYEGPDGTWGLLNPKWSPHHIVANFGSLKLFEFVVKRTGEINPSLNNGVTAFHLAAESGCLEMCKYIIERIEDAIHNTKRMKLENFVGNSRHWDWKTEIKNPADKFGMTPLHYSAKNGCIDVYHLILENSDDKYPANFSGQFPLHIAARKGHLELCKYIIERTEVKSFDNNYFPFDNINNTVLHNAAQSGNLKLYKYLVGFVDNL